MKKIKIITIILGIILFIALISLLVASKIPASEETQGELSRDENSIGDAILEIFTLISGLFSVLPIIIIILGLIIYLIISIKNRLLIQNINHNLDSELKKIVADKNFINKIRTVIAKEKELTKSYYRRLLAFLVLLCLPTVLLILDLGEIYTVISVIALFFGIIYFYIIMAFEILATLSRIKSNIYPEKIAKKALYKYIQSLSIDFIIIKRTLCNFKIKILVDRILVSSIVVSWVSILWLIIYSLFNFSICC